MMEHTQHWSYQGNCFVIRPWRKGDEPSLVHHANNKKIWDALRNAFPHPYTQRDAERWIQQMMASRKPTHFAIEVEQEAVGAIGFSMDKDVHSLNAEVGYWLGENHWNKGIISESLVAISHYAFGEFQLARLYARVFENNSASQKALTKAGFYLECVHPFALFKHGQIWDELLYVRLHTGGFQIRVYGKVQGVFFRKYTLEKASSLKLKGFVRNEPDGTVLICAEGLVHNLNQLVDWCKEGSPAAEVARVEIESHFEPQDYESFTIRQ